MTSAVDYRNGADYDDASWDEGYYASCAQGPATYPTIRPGRPVYLSGVNTPGLADLEAAGYDVGLLLQPGNGTNAAAGTYRYWAADNGCFAEAQGKPWDEARWFSWLERLATPDLRWGNWAAGTLSRSPWLADDEADLTGPPAFRGCLFATAPDVVGDAAATWDRSLPYFARIRALGLPVALVAQDGIEDLPHPWDELERYDALFLGGSTAWKISNEARDVAREAQLAGKFVHMGRVNSNKRIRIAATWDVDSTDGTFLGFGPTANLPRLVAWLEGLRDNPTAPAPTWLAELKAALDADDEVDVAQGTLFAA